MSVARQSCKGIPLVPQQGGQEGTIGAAAAVVSTQDVSAPAAQPAAAQPAAAQAPSAPSDDARAAAAAALARLPWGEGVPEAERLLALCDALAQVWCGHAACPTRLQAFLMS